jgi:hypothetical protein
LNQFFSGKATIIDLAGKPTYFLVTNRVSSRSKVILSTLLFHEINLIRHFLNNLRLET